jgi:hypothetical protein
MHKWRRAIGITAHALAAVLALTACRSSQAREDNFALEIQAGRLGVMTNQIQSLLGEPLPSVLEETDDLKRTRIADNLRLAVYDLARLKMRACPEGQLEPALCKEDFAPDWALRAEAPPPDWPELEKRIEAASDAVMPVWSVLCAKARETAGPDDEICPME